MSAVRKTAAARTTAPTFHTSEYVDVDIVALLPDGPVRLPQPRGTDVAALIVSLTLVTAGLILDLAARFWDRRTLRRCDHDHAADHAAMPLGTLLPGPSETPVGDLAAKVVGL